MPKIKFKKNGSYVDSPDEICQYVNDMNAVQYVIITWYDDTMQEHRDIKPAIISYDELTKMITSETWCKHGGNHRTDGPAVMHYRDDGSVFRSYMYIHDVRITKKELAEILGLPDSSHIKYPLSKENQTTLKLIYQ